MRKYVIIYEVTNRTNNSVHVHVHVMAKKWNILIELTQVFNFHRLRVNVALKAINIKKSVCPR